MRERIQGCNSLKNCRGLSPDWKLEFTIELEPGAAPISKAPYRIGPKELEEFKMQLQKLRKLDFRVTKYVTLSSARFILKEEGWSNAHVHRLP